MTQVTEADRDAAADWLQSVDDDGHTYDAIRRGQCDQMDLVQAFTRHREQAVQEAVAGIETRFWSIVDPNSVPSDMWDALDRMASAYRARQEAVAERDARIAALEAKLATVQRNYDELTELIDEAHAALQEIDNDAG